MSDSKNGQPVDAPDLISRCKRIMALIDAYVEKPTAHARGDIRGALMEELAAPAPTAGVGPTASVTGIHAASGQDPAEQNPWRQRRTLERIPLSVVQERLDADARLEAEERMSAESPPPDLRSLLEEVRHCFTRDDDLPDDLLPRIDCALSESPERPEQDVSGTRAERPR